jgi:1,4-dihydroxy-2-naphthoate polyprenyltransferase
MLGKSKAWFLAFRPWTFTIFILPIIEISLWYKKFNNLLLVILLAILLGSITNLLNLYLDNHYCIDLDGESNKILKDKLINPKSLLNIIYILILIYIFLVIYLSRKSIIILISLIIALLLSFSYSFTPWNIKTGGFGELLCLISFLLYSIPMQYLISGKINSFFVFYTFDNILVTTSILLLNNIEDIEGDTRSNARTLAVKLGERRSIILLSLILIIALGYNIYWNKFYLIPYIFLFILGFLTVYKKKRKIAALLLLSLSFVRMFNIDKGYLLDKINKYYICRYLDKIAQKLISL